MQAPSTYPVADLRKCRTVSVWHLSALLAVALIAAQPATAQDQNETRELTNRISKLEQDIRNLQRQVPGSRAPSAPAGSEASNAQVIETDITVRVLSLERIIEQLTGQVEETRFTTERMSRQLKVLTDDVSLRLAAIEQSLGLTGAVPAPQQQGLAVPPPASPAPATSTPAPPSVAAAAPPPDETVSLRTPPTLSADGPLSQPVSSQPQTSRSIAPAPAPQAAASAPASPTDGLAAGGGFEIRTDAQGKALPPDASTLAAAPPPPPLPTPQQQAPRAAPSPGPVASSQVASLPAGAVALPDGTPKQQYEFAFDLLKRQDYPKAEGALREFLKRHSKDPLAGNAQYWLGETYYVRGDFQQAAVEFMAGYQKYPKTNKGPDNLLKLGMAMGKLNQTQGACTALGRIAKDYPEAPGTVIKSAQAERTRLKCK